MHAWHVRDPNIAIVSNIFTQAGQEGKWHYDVAQNMRYKQISLRKRTKTCMHQQRVALRFRGWHAFGSRLNLRSSYGERKHLPGSGVQAVDSNSKLYIYLEPRNICTLEPRATPNKE